MQHIMIDLEMNKIERQIRDDKKLSSELIEIGAVRMDESFKMLDQYQTYVMTDFGPIDSRIRELTGITDEKLIGAPRFAEAMDNFTKWIGPGKTMFYSWSLSDIRQFQSEADFKGYDKPIIRQMEKCWVDFQEEYSKLLGIEKKIQLKQAVQAADYEFAGAQHTALADAVNTAEILCLSQHPKEFEKVMKPVLDLFRDGEQKDTLLDMCPEFFASVMEKGKYK